MATGVESGDVRASVLPVNDNGRPGSANGQAAPFKSCDFPVLYKTYISYKSV